MLSLEIKYNNPTNLNIFEKYQTVLLVFLTILKIEGMTEDFCKRRIENGFN